MKTGDVGGGFGTKAFLYREYPLALEAARRLGKPVKWSADRTEHFLADTQGRDNVSRIEAALDSRARILAVESISSVISGLICRSMRLSFPGSAP